MTAEIGDFSPLYLQRITQLTNKSNQFNLTTKRYTAEQMEAVYNSDEYIRLYGKLYDKFGDNGVVAVTIGKTASDIHLHHLPLSPQLMHIQTYNLNVWYPYR